MWVGATCKLRTLDLLDRVWSRTGVWLQDGTTICILAQAAHILGLSLVGEESNSDLFNLWLK